MTFVFVLFAVLCAALAYNVVKPHFYHPKWMVFSFLFGWLGGELAIHLIAIEALLLALFILGDVVNGFWGFIGLAVIVASWVMLTYHYYSGYKMKAIMESIVAPHRDSDNVSIYKHLEESNWRRLLNPFQAFRDKEIDLIKDIHFHTVDDLNLKLDIRRPKNPIEKAPVLLQIHGGGWTYGYGSKNEQGVPLTVEMAKRGWVSVSISYRLSPKATFPEHIIDCKRALCWVKEHIAEYGGDPDFIVATGGSAGGHLSSLLSLSANEKSFQPGFEDLDTSVQGCVPFYGIYDLLDEQRLQNSVGLEIIMRKNIIKQTKAEAPELYRLMSPVTHITKNAPPFLVLHGDKDTLTSYAEAQYFVSKLSEVSAAPVAFAAVPGGQHAFDLFASLRCDFAIAGIAERIEQWHREFQGK
jgi:acetyl esterase/lipase